MVEETIRSVIGDDAADLLEQERAALDRLREVAEKLSPGGEAARNAAMIRAHLDEFFLLVVIGEVKAGKSSFINALLGEKVQAEGPLPLTDRIWVLRQGPERNERAIDEYVRELTLPNELLGLFHIVDTPGTNSIVLQHQRITESFIPKADLTLFITSIDRPFSESEHQFLDFVRDRWRRNIIVVLTKIDVREDDEVPTVVRYIQDNCRRFYGIEPRVYPVSAKVAERAAAVGDDAALEASGIPALLRYLRSRLAEEERVRLKLISPAEAGLALLDELERLASSRRRSLEADFQALNDLEVQVTQGGSELKERNDVFVAALDEELREVRRRAGNFVDSEVRLANLRWGRGAERTRRFERDVIGDLDERLRACGHRAADWLIKEQLARTERSLRFLSERVDLERYAARVAADAGDASPQAIDEALALDRDALVADVERIHQQEYDSAALPETGERLVRTGMNGVLAQLAVQTLALASLVALLLSTTRATWWSLGLLTASALFVVAMAVAPRRRAWVKERLNAEVDAFASALRRRFQRSLADTVDRTTDRLRAAYGPYLTFYRATSSELDQVVQLQTEVRGRLTHIAEAAQRLELAPQATATPD